MLRSCSIANDKLEIFQLFIHRYLDGNPNYKKSIDGILSETHRLAIGESNIYTIDRSNFDIILKLNRSAHDYFRDLDITNLCEEDYKKILNIFESGQLSEI